MLNSINNPPVKPFDVGQLTLEAYICCYLTIHESTCLAGPSYLDFVAPLKKWGLSTLGNISLDQLTPDVLRGYYEKLHRQCQLPLCMITGIHHLLEVALAYAESIGMLFHL